jgi:hypothetical protein
MLEASLALPCFFPTQHVPLGDRSPWFTTTVTTMGSPCQDHFLADRVGNYIDIPDFSAVVSHTRGTTGVNSRPMLDRIAELTRVI